MIDTDKYENMRLLFLDFIDTASDEVDEGAWRDKLTMLDDLLAEVKRLQKRSKKLENALLTLADGAGDVPMFNKGGEAYEALFGELTDAPLLLAEVKRLQSEPTVTVDDYHKKGHLYVTVHFPDGEQYVGLVEKWEGGEE